MILSVELNQKIVNFLTLLPNMETRNSWEALINSASLDEPLQAHIDFSGSPGQFFQRLVSTLIKYGTLEDDRHALIAVLEVAQTMVGKNRKAECRALINEVRTLLLQDIQQNIDNGYAPRQNSSMPQKSGKTLSEIAELKRLETRKQELDQNYQIVSENIQALNDDYHNQLKQFDKLPIKRQLDIQQAERDDIEQEMREIEAKIERLRS